MNRDYVMCSSCGKRVSNMVTVDPQDGLVVRAWIECPECVQQRKEDEPDIQGERHLSHLRFQENKKLKEFIRYWSYCTWQGMRKTCPEKAEELLSAYTDLGTSYPGVSWGTNDTAN